MIDVKKATDSIARLGLLRYFPADPIVRTELVGQVCEMCSDNAQVDWLVSRTLKLWNQWEGIQELRAVLCSKFKPADGIECYSYLPQFIDGIPSERESAPAQIAAPAMKALPAGEPVSAAPSLAGTIADLARAKSLTRSLAGAPTPPVREIPVIRITDANRITEADIRRAEEQLRESRAKAEVGL